MINDYSVILFNKAHIDLTMSATLITSEQYQTSKAFILGVYGLTEPFSINELEKSYRTISLKYHPDSQTFDSTLKYTLVQMTEARDVTKSLIEIFTQDRDEKIAIFSNELAPKINEYFNCAYAKHVLGNYYAPVLIGCNVIGIGINLSVLSFKMFCVYRFIRLFI